MKKMFIVLIGNIGSGKTTLSKALAKEGYIVCCRDSLRYMIGGGDYRFDPKLEGSIAEAHDHMLAVFLDNKHDVVIDEVNVQSFRRMDLNELAEEFEYTKIAIVLPKLAKKISVSRRVKDPHGTFNRKVWEGVWDRFDAAYTEPTANEGFDCTWFMRKNDKKETEHIIRYLKNIKNKKEKPYFKETKEITNDPTY